MVNVRAVYAYDTHLASEESWVVTPPDDDYAVQDSKDECDINTIVRRFGLTGQLPIAVHAPVYQDFEGVFDYQTALNQIISAEQSFMEMPADIRKRFNHDPQAFLEFCSDESNRAEAEKLGLIYTAPESVDVSTVSGAETER